MPKISFKNIWNWWRNCIKRNKKKYRTTVISLVVSITVFISLSTFLNYAFGMTGIYYKEMDYNVTIYSSYSDYQKNDENSAKNTYEYYQKLMENSNVDKYAIMRTLSLDKCNIEQFATEEFKNYYKESYSASIDEAMTISITSIGDKAYRDYVKKIGTKYDNCKDAIIYCDDSSIYEYSDENKKSERMIPFDFKENDVVKGITVGNEEVNLKIAKISDQSPLDANRYTFSGTFLVSDELMDKLKDYGCYSAYVNASNAEEFCKKLDEEETRLAKEGIKLNYTNYNEEAEQQNKMVLLISIFLYGFIIVITLIGVKDVLKDESIDIVKKLQKRNIEVVMLTGDNEKTANAIAKQIGVDKVIANVLPKQKAEEIKKLKQKGLVMMCGDGINDSVSLVTADIGVSVSSGTDIAMDSSNVVLMNDNLEKIEDLLSISQKTITNIKQNLFWAFFYNICMIPIACGVLEPLGIVMNPMMAAFAMTISSLTVILNALRLKRMDN